MKRLRNIVSLFALVLLLAPTAGSAQDGCAFCELQYRQCVRSGTNIDVCWQQREDCYVMNGCMVP